MAAVLPLVAVAGLAAIASVLSSPVASAKVADVVTAASNTASSVSGGLRDKIAADARQTGGRPRTWSSAPLAAVTVLCALLGSLKT